MWNTLPKTLTLLMTKICDFPYPFDALFMTFAADTVSPNVICERLLLMILLIMMKQYFLKQRINSKTRVQNHTLFKTKIAKLIQYL